MDVAKSEPDHAEHAEHADDVVSTARLPATPEADRGEAERHIAAGGMSDTEARDRRKVTTALLIGLVLLVVVVGGGLFLLRLFGQ